MQLILNALQAGGLFDVFVSHGNYDDREYAYTQHKKDEFIESCALGINEYWYSTKSGSSMKIYFDGFRDQPVWAHMQTYNPLKEKTLQVDFNSALVEYIASERAKG